MPSQAEIDAKKNRTARSKRKDRGVYTTNNLKELRKAHELSMEVVANACGTQYQHLSQIEKGSGVGVGMALKLAKYFGKSVEEIWQLKEDN